MKSLLRLSVRIAGYCLRVMGSCLIYTLCWLGMAAFVVWLCHYQPWQCWQQQVPSPSKCILTLDLNCELKEAAPLITTSNPLSRPSTFTELILALDRAVADPAVAGLFVRLNRGFSATLAQREELYHVIRAFRAVGKKVGFHAETLDKPADYYLASSGSVVSVEPYSLVNFVGLGAEVFSLKTFLNSWGVHSEFIRRESYKSGPDMFTEPSISPQNREMLTHMLTSLEDFVIKGIAEGRGLAPSVVSQLMEEGPFSTLQALKSKLIDKIMSESHAAKSFKKAIDPQAVFCPLMAYEKGSISPLPNYQRPVIILGMEGSLVMGGEKNLWGGDIPASSWAHFLEGQSKNPYVKLIVIRLNTPGGDVMASERLYHALQKCRKKGKKVVISLGGCGASGGYWLALASDAIVADASSLTGSIGVYMGKFMVSPFLDKQGIGWDLVGLKNNAHWFSLRKPLSEVTRAKLESFCDEIYGTFLERTAQHRKLSLEVVRRYAGGRVLTGQQAYEYGLVDKVGGLREALSYGRTLSGLSAKAPYSIAVLARSWYHVAQELAGRFLSMAQQASHALIKVSDVEGVKFQAKSLDIR